MNREKLACECNHVTYGQIVDAVKSGADSIDKVQEMTGCTKGCGQCLEFIKVFIRDILRFPEDYI